jgi:hypothetical protein
MIFGVSLSLPIEPAGPPGGAPPAFYKKRLLVSVIFSEIIRFADGGNFSRRGKGDEFQ